MDRRSSRATATSGVLFAAAHVPVNVLRYGRTWIATGTPLVLLARVAWSILPGRRVEAAAVTALGLALAAVYLVYRPFENGGSCASCCRRWPSPPC